MQLRAYKPHDFNALYKLDQSCFPPGIAYSKTTLRYFLVLSAGECLLAVEDGKIAGFILVEVSAPLAHIITLDVAEAHRRSGVGSLLLSALESKIVVQGVRAILLETGVNNNAAVAFWERHGYRIEGALKRYYLSSIDAYEMRKLLPSARK